jgi:hypothetical protein
MATGLDNNVMKILDTNSKPEWLRIPAAIEIFGLRRSLLYSLIQDGLIKSACVRRRGNVRGVRLISYDSLADYVESMVGPTSPDEARSAVVDPHDGDDSTLE